MGRFLTLYRDCGRDDCEENRYHIERERFVGFSTKEVFARGLKIITSFTSERSQSLRFTMSRHTTKGTIHRFTPENNCLTPFFITGIGCTPNLEAVIAISSPTTNTLPLL